MIEIKTKKIKDSDIMVPGSKSYTHRIMIACALSSGDCRVINPLRSQDTLLTLGALEKMGAMVSDHGDTIEIKGLGGKLGPYEKEIYLANSGTSMRLLTGIASLGRGEYLFTGTKRMHHRPIGHLLDALHQLGIAAISVNGDKCPPLKITGGHPASVKTRINCSVSSQYLSSLLLMAPCTPEGLEIEVTHGPVSRPYIDMTLSIMERFGIQAKRDGYTHFKVEGGQSYRPGQYPVEPDGSQAGYFWGSAAITGARVKVKGVTRQSTQGDVKLADVFEKMGCSVDHEHDGIAVTGGRLTGVAVDMADMPDMVPTLAVVAAFAKGTTTISNVAHLKAKESNRLEATCTELGKMGIKATAGADELIIEGGTPKGAVISTYDDHRIAMSFAMAGLKVPGVKIENESCVEKSFPNFWDVFDTLYA